MNSNQSDRNGRGLEYALSQEVSKLRNFVLSAQSFELDERDKSKFLSLPESLMTAYGTACRRIASWISSKFNELETVSVHRLGDDSVPDFEFRSKSKSVSISLKHNHQGIRHPRPYSLAQWCAYTTGTSEDLFHRNQMDLIANEFRMKTAKTQLFRELDIATKDTLYRNVCLACKASLDHWMAMDDTLPSKLFSFLVKEGFYQIIVRTRRDVSVGVTDYISLPQPTKTMIATQGNRLYLTFNNNWGLNLRVHSARSDIGIPGTQLSLKFDAQLLNQTLTNQEEFI